MFIERNSTKSGDISNIPCHLAFSYLFWVVWSGLVILYDISAPKMSDRSLCYRQHNHILEVWILMSHRERARGETVLGVWLSRLPYIRMTIMLSWETPLPLPIFIFEEIHLKIGLDSRLDSMRIVAVDDLIIWAKLLEHVFIYLIPRKE